MEPDRIIHIILKKSNPAHFINLYARNILKTILFFLKVTVTTYSNVEQIIDTLQTTYTTLFLLIDYISFHAFFHETYDDMKGKDISN